MSRRPRNANSINQPDLFFVREDEPSGRKAARSCANSNSNVTQFAPTRLDPDRRDWSSERRPGEQVSVIGQPSVAVVSGQSRPTARGPLCFREAPARVITIEDMPGYPPDLIVAVKKSIKEITTERVLLTYKEIDAFFGISRATVARRLKDGLVPGIRIRHGRVLEDGPVRRLDRTQVLYLLLAVRVRRPN